MSTERRLALLWLDWACWALLASFFERACSLSKFQGSQLLHYCIVITHTQYLNTFYFSCEFAVAVYSTTDAWILVLQLGCWTAATSPLFVSKDTSKLGLVLQATFLWEFYEWYMRYIPPALTNQISTLNLLQLWSRDPYCNLLCTYTTLVNYRKAKYIVITIVERNTGKYHEFITEYCYECEVRVTIPKAKNE